MIISFNPIIFQNQDAEIQSTLAKILLELLTTNIHFIDIKSISEIFYNENGKYIFDSNDISKTHFSSQQQKNFKDFLNKKGREAITGLYKQHLMHIVIGDNLHKKETHPKDAYRIIIERSKIIVENGINDWKFLKGICQKYSSGKTKRRSIYELLNKAIKDEILEPENCGGIGEITKVTQKWIKSNRYQNIYQYKLMALFDSDKQDLNKETPNKSQIEYFKLKPIDIIQAVDYEHEPTDLIIWHILYKRKIENYIPLSILFANIKSITTKQETELKGKTNDELDFIEYNQDNIGLGGQRIKELFPEMFLSDFSYREFEQRCGHHKIFLQEANELVSEMEQILLKIAKII